MRQDEIFMEFGDDLDNRKNELELNWFLSESLVDPCPKCESNNTHDCEIAEIMDDTQASNISSFKIGSECDFAIVVNDILIAHCDTCNILWCLECGKIIEITDIPLDQVPIFVSNHLASCGDDIKTIYLGLLTELDIECSLCQKRVEEGFAIDAKNQYHNQGVEALLGDEHADWLICLDCLEGFKKRLKKIVKSHITFEIV